MDTLGIATSTLNGYVSTEVIDNAHAAIPFFWFLTGRKGMYDRASRKFTEKSSVKYVEGGQYIQVNLRLGTNTTAKSHGPYDVVDTTPQSTLNYLLYNWKETSVQITISNKEKRINKGRAALFNLLNDKINEAEDSLFEAMNTMLFGDGTGNESKDILGLGAIVNTTGTIGGLSRTTYPQLQCQNESTAMALAISGGAGSLTNMWNNLYKSKKLWKPDVHITTQTLAEKYESLLAPNMRFADKESANMGWDFLTFKGAPIIFDDQCPAGYWYMLNTRFINMVIHPDADFASVPFAKPVNQKVSVGSIEFMGQLTCSNFQRQGRLTGKTA